jgi:hypothetical protein
LSKSNAIVDDSFGDGVVSATSRSASRLTSYSAVLKQSYLLKKFVRS